MKETLVVHLSYIKIPLPFPKGSNKKENEQLQKPKDIIPKTNEKIIGKLKVSERRVEKEEAPKAIDGNDTKLDKTPVVPLSLIKIPPSLIQRLMKKEYDTKLKKFFAKLATYR